MNLNQPLIHKKTRKDASGRPAFKAKEVMGPPKGPIFRSTRRKSNSTSSSATVWGKPHHSIFNNSTLRSGSTTMSTEVESRVITALTEGRGDARCEVGLASIDLSLPNLVLCQISDVHSYLNTLTKINILNPTDIIVPSTFLDSGSRLIDKVKKQFPNIKILGVPRKTFNKTNGMDRILDLCLPSNNAICVGLQHKYYALAAASALVTYLQNNLNIYNAKASINVSYQESEGYAIIDVSTADRLELVSSTKPAQATRYSTLFGVLNYCHTKIGARLLRSTILQPPCAPRIIEETSQCVSELIKHPQTLVSIQAILQKVSNVDQLLTLTSMPFGTSDNCSVRQLNYLLLLNGILELVEPLKGVIEHFQQPFFTELRETLESENFESITRQIRNTIHPSAQFAKSEAGVAQRCYAIKSGINGLLDLVRKTYAERLNDMTEYVKHLGNRYNMALTLGNNNTKGYHIVFKLNCQQKRTFKKSDLPPEFIQVYRLAASFTMKTAELINYSTRLEDIMLEILKISNLMIRNVIVELKQYLGFFYKFCEDIARLDLLQSLAEASRRGRYVRPKFGDFTELVNARHPMLELLIGDQRVPNPISICKDYNVQIITGPNGSGKSIYIRQVMLLQVMAQVGCYVPADSALFRPMSRMFARIYLEDNMEYGASSFILEMKEVKYMMSLLSENSLFIIDELCRSTAANEGAALAMAICEKFCTTSVFLYVTTHYTSLADLAEMYLNVRAWQMETIASGETPRELSLDYKFRLIPGVTSLEHYGVYIVKKIWPESILREVYDVLDACKKQRSGDREYVGMNESTKLKYKLESNLRKLKSRGKLTKAAINKLLNDYQNELQKIDVLIDFNMDNGESGADLSPSENNFSGNFRVEEVATHLSLLDVATPRSVEGAFETSSYQNLSNFLREDSENVKKLIPEVTLACSEREFVLPESQQSERQDSSYSEASTGKEKTLPASTPTLWGVNRCNMSDDEVRSIVEELQSISESFSEDDDFDFSQESSYKTALSSINSDCGEDRHVFPVVTVVEGPQWSSDSDSSRDVSEPSRTKEVEGGCSHLSESMSYSPLCPSSFSQDFDGDEVSENFDHTGFCTGLDELNVPQSSTSSSLHFMSKNGVQLSGNGATTTDTNLGNISMNRDVDNITIENLKSVSVATVEKASSSNEKTGQTISSSAKESDYLMENQSKPRYVKRLKKFIPPKKLTKREIEEEFAEQDRKIYEASVSDSDFSKYLSLILNRPSVKQVQNSEHLALVRKTEKGVEVIPAQSEPPKKSKRCPFQRNLSNNSNIDVSIFSDKNAKHFEEFVNSDERDIKRFKFDFGSQKNKVFNFQPQSISEYAANEQFLFRGDNLQPSQGFPSLTPEGYYKQNREDINNIMNKYLGRGGEAGPTHDSNIFDKAGPSNELSIFDKAGPSNKLSIFDKAGPPNDLSIFDKAGPSNELSIFDKAGPANDLRIFDKAGVAGQSNDLTIFDKAGPSNELSIFDKAGSSNELSIFETCSLNEMDLEL